MRINDNKTTTGFLNIVLDILKQSNTPLAGKSAEDRAEIRQWIEYVVVYAANANSSNNVLKVSGAGNSSKSKLITFVLGTRCNFIDSNLSGIRCFNDSRPCFVLCITRHCGKCIHDSDFHKANFLYITGEIVVS